MKVRIYANPWDTLTNIAFLIQRDGEWQIAKPMKLEFEPLKEGTDTPASLSLGAEVATEFLMALATALDDRGIKPPHDHHIAGELKATKAHLEDMRGLLAWFTQKDESSEA